VPFSLRNVLVAVDPLADQHPCIDKAVRLAVRYGSAIELFICDTDQSLHEGGGSALAAYEHRQQARLRRLEMLEGLAGPLRAAGLNVSTAAAWNSSLATGITEHAIRTSVDLVVKDAHRHLPAPMWATSHTDPHLIREVPGALLLVHPNNWSSTPKLAVAVDPCHPVERSPQLDGRLMEVARSLSTRLSGSLEVVHVVGTPPHLPDVAVTDEARAAAEAKALVEVRALLGTADVECPIHLEHGPVAKTLLSFTARHHPNILVIGAPARPRRDELLAGGAAAQLLDHVDCDLLVIKQPGFVSSLLITD
jgi:universal stress protein E